MTHNEVHLFPMEMELPFMTNPKIQIIQPYNRSLHIYLSLGWCSGHSCKILLWRMSIILCIGSYFHVGRSLAVFPSILKTSFYECYVDNLSESKPGFSRFLFTWLSPQSSSVLLEYLEFKASELL